MNRVPRLSRTVVARPRLDARLSEALTEQVTIVRAPTGYGKTVLVSRWLRSVEPAVAERAAWIDLQTVSPDVSSFWAAVNDAAVIDLRSTVQQPSGVNVLVLDGYDRHWDSRLSDDLERLIHRGHPIHLVILTQTMTSLEAPTTAAALDLSVITADDLAWTRDELDRASVAAGLTAASATLDDVARVTGGWPLAVRALFNVIGAARCELGPGAFDLALGDLAVHLLKRLDGSPDELAALQRASLAPYLTVGIVGELAPDADGAAVISVAEEAGLGSWTQRFGSGRPVFELLEPIRLELLSRSQAGEPATFEQSTQRVTAVLERDGDAVSALRHAIRVADIGVAEALVIRRFGSVFSGGAPALFGAVRSSGAADLAASTVLLTVTGLLTEYHGDGIAAAMAYYRAAGDLTPSRIRSSDPQHRYWPTLARVIALRKTGRMAEAQTRLTSLLAADTVSHGLPAFAWAEIGMTSLRLGSTAHAAASFHRAALMAGHDQGLEAFALGSQALAHAVRGEIGRAEAACEQIAERLGADTHLLPQSLVPAAVARHLIATEHGHGADAAGPAAVGLDDRPLGEFRPYAVFARALRAACRGERSSALDLLERELVSPGDPPAGNVERAPLVSLRASLMIAERRLMGAQHVITSFPDGTGALRTVSARLALIKRDVRRAQALVEGPPAEGASVRTRVEALLIRGTVMKKIGHLSASDDAFDQAARISRSHRLGTPFVLAIDESTVVAELTERERVVLERLPSDDSLDAIATSLVVSVNTVKTQTRSIYRKLGASSRREAVGIAFEVGLLRSGSALGRPRSRSRHVVA